MSHFTVLVITDDANDLEKALAPFQENNMGDCPQEFLEFNDQTEEVVQGWEESTLTCYFLTLDLVTTYFPDRQVTAMESSIFPGLIMLDTTEAYEEIPEGGNFRTRKLRDGVEQKEVPVQKFYENFAEYVKDYHGYKGPDDNGRYGYYENPNRKWDWWTLGGRWNGFFKLKDGGVGVAGEPSFMGSLAPAGRADQAIKSQIDFDGMLGDAVAEGEKIWARLQEVIAGIDLSSVKIWKTFLREKEEGKITIEDARILYHEQPVVKAISADKELGVFMGCEIEHYHLHEENSKEKYIADLRCAAFSTFAVLYNGEWYERGEMGWFGCVSDEKSKYDWSAQFMDILDSLPDTAVLSVVDCHI